MAVITIRMKTTLLHLCCLVASIFVPGTLFQLGVDAFNLDPFSLILVRHSDFNEPGSENTPTFFGYTSGFMREDQKTWLVVGAPRANVSWNANDSEPGAVYKCQMTDDAKKTDVCSELRMDFEHTEHGGFNFHRYNQWLGVSMDVSSSGQLVVCGHRRMREDKSVNDTNHIHGICFSRNNTMQNATVMETNWLPSDDHHKFASARDSNRTNGTRTVYRYPYSQRGASVRFATEGTVVMGGPGAWHWQGALYVSDGSKICAIEDVTADDSYWGYSVTSIRRPANLANRDTFYFAGGAPRYNETGRVYIVEVNSTCYKETVFAISSTAYGSYFGASILAEDTDGDGLDELFIGAPFENLTLGDEGAVHYYANDGENNFSYSKRLTGLRQADGRFGTAIASTGDLNIDGFNDIIIGSPFEDEGRGAIYIFIGSKSGIVVPYSQRIAASDLPELRSIRSFGHSLSSGSDIDGDKYPDVSIGAYMNDSVAVMRARPVHTVTAKIWFPTAFIASQRPNCSKSEDQSFQTTLIISFFYTIPQQELENIEFIYILVGYQSRPATLGANQAVVFTDESPSVLPVKFFVVPCLAKAKNNRCVSFKVAGNRATYMRLFDRNLYIENRDTARNPTSYSNDASFYLSEDLEYDKIVFIRSHSRQNQTFVSENGKLTTKDIVEGEEFGQDANFSFTRGRYLPCIKHLSYELNIDSTRRGFLLNQGGWITRSVGEKVSFTVENLDQPLNRSWTVQFPRFPKNIAIPMEFQLNMSGPSLNDSRSTSHVVSTDVIRLDKLSPLLNPLSQNRFTGQIGFYKECGDDDYCDASLSVNYSLSGRHSRGLVIGCPEELPLRFYVENTGEPAYSVRMEIVHPSLFPYSRLSSEDSCNQVTALSLDMASKESSNSSLTMRGLHLDVENQIHTNGSLAFKVYFTTLNFQEESDFPKDSLELQCRVGTHGDIQNDTESVSFQVPIRYEAALVASRSSKDSLVEFSTRAAESSKPSERTLTLKHQYEISNYGPGIMPSVIIDVMLPDDSILNVTKIRNVTVTFRGKRSGEKFQRVINGTEIFQKSLVTPTTTATTTATATAATTAATTVVNPDNGNQTTAPVSQEIGSQTTTPAIQGPNIIFYLLQDAAARTDKQTIRLDCANGSCSAFRRYNIGSMYVEDTVDVSITVAVSAVNLSTIKNLEKLTYTSSVRMSPYNISDDIRKWKEGKVKITENIVQTSTHFRPSIENPIPIWLIVVGVGLGILHFAAFILILKKCGFFRRKHYERMQDEMREGRAEHVMSPDAEAEQQEVASQYDNELLREQVSLKSQSEDSAVGSCGEESKKTRSTVDALLAQHPGIDFTAD